MMFLRPTRLYPTLVATFCFLSACALEGQDGEGNALIAADSGDVTQDEASVLLSAADTLAGNAPLATEGTPTALANLNPEQAAQTLAQRYGTRLQPAGCATSQVQGAEVVVDLQACTGPFGLISTSGQITFVFEQSGSGLSFRANATALQMNRSTIDLQANGSLRRDPQGGLILEVRSEGQGQGPRGRTLLRTGTYTLRSEAQSGCYTLDGSWQLEVGNYEHTLSLQSLRRCDGACPTQGSATLDAPRRRIELRFDGSNQASWTETRNSGLTREGQVELACGG